MKIERKRSRAAEVYTASLNDILFFLMLFFLIIATMVTPMAIKVSLPKSSTSKPLATKKNINLAITADLRYYIDDQEIRFEEIEPALLAIVGDLPENERPIVLLQGDESITLQSLVRVMDIGNRNGIAMTIFAVLE